MPKISDLPEDSTLTGAEVVPASEGGSARRLSLTALYNWIVATFTASATWTAITTAINGKAADTHSHSAATTSAAGLMSAADKAKLDGIAPGAQVNAVTSVNGQTGAVVVNASASIAGMKETLSGLIPTAGNKVYPLDLSASYGYSVDSLGITCSAGSCKAKLSINGTDVTGITDVAVSTAGTAFADATALNAVTSGKLLALTLSDNSGALDVAYIVTKTRA